MEFRLLVWAKGKLAAWTRLRSKATALGWEHLSMSNANEVAAAAELSFITDCLDRWNDRAFTAAEKVIVTFCTLLSRLVINV